MPISGAVSSWDKVPMRVVGWPQLSDRRAEIFLQGPQVDSGVFEPWRGLSI